MNTNACLLQPLLAAEHELLCLGSTIVDKNITISGCALVKLCNARQLLDDLRKVQLASGWMKFGLKRNHLLLYQ